MNTFLMRRKLRKYGVDFTDAEIMGETFYKSALLGANEWAAEEGAFVTKAFSSPKGRKVLTSSLIYAVRWYMYSSLDGILSGNDNTDADQASEIMKRAGRIAAQKVYNK